MFELANEVPQGSTVLIGGRVVPAARGKGLRLLVPEQTLCTDEVGSGAARFAVVEGECGVIPGVLRAREIGLVGGIVEQIGLGGAVRIAEVHHHGAAVDRAVEHQARLHAVGGTSVDENAFEVLGMRALAPAVAVFPYKAGLLRLVKLHIYRFYSRAAPLECTMPDLTLGGRAPLVWLGVDHQRDAAGVKRRLFDHVELAGEEGKRGGRCETRLLLSGFARDGGRIKSIGEECGVRAPEAALYAVSLGARNGDMGLPRLRGKVVAYQKRLTVAHEVDDGEHHALDVVAHDHSRERVGADANIGALRRQELADELAHPDFLDAIGIEVRGVIDAARTAGRIARGLRAVKGALPVLVAPRGRAVGMIERNGDATVAKDGDVYRPLTPALLRLARCFAKVTCDGGEFLQGALAIGCLGMVGGGDAPGRMGGVIPAQAEDDGWRGGRRALARAGDEALGVYRHGFARVHDEDVAKMPLRKA